MPELLAALGTESRRTVFRKLRELECLTSYSHRGAHHALPGAARFDEHGLWRCGAVCFSVHGTLLEAAAAAVEAGEVGYFADELDTRLHVDTKNALRKLVADDRLTREKVAGRFLYCAVDPKTRRRQMLGRRALLAEPGAAKPLPDSAHMSAELQAAIVLFFSLLDEQQRRLYAGLEALKTGRGGDTRIAALLGMDAGTVARGRRELLDHDIEVGRVRRRGGGRKSVEKKRQR